MILPEPRRDATSQKGKAFICTILMAVGAYTIMLLGSFSLEKPDRRVYREVDLASFAPPEPDPEFSRTSSSDAEATEEPADATETAATAEAPTLAQLDLTELFPEDGSLTVETPNVENTRTQSRGTGNSADEIAVQSGGLQGLGDLNALDNLGGAPVPAARGRSGRSPGNSGGGISLSGGTASGASPDVNTSLGGTGDVVGSNTRRAEGTANAEFTVDRVSLDAFGNDYDRLEVQELINWMKKNPGDLPIGVRQLIRHRPSFLSSVTSFMLDGQYYELYLMCKEKLYEIHIVLVDGNGSTYLVDRSFQKLSTYLSEGQVRRAQAGEITAIRSQRNAASNEASQEFYSLFLSWWEQAKVDS